MKKPKGAKRKHRLLKIAEGLNMERVDQLLALLKGEAQIVIVKGRTYTVQKSVLGWEVQDAAAGSHKHTVNHELTACSCEDNKFRGHLCKHIDVLRRVK